MMKDKKIAAQLLGFISQRTEVRFEQSGRVVIRFVATSSQMEETQLVSQAVALLAKQIVRRDPGKVFVESSPGVEHTLVFTGFRHTEERTFQGTFWVNGVRMRCTGVHLHVFCTEADVEWLTAAAPTSVVQTLWMPKEEAADEDDHFTYIFE